MKVLVTALIMFIMFSCQAQDTNKIKIYKENKSISIGLMQDGKREGNWTYYNESNNVKKICHYKNNVLDGKLLKFDSNGNLLLSINFINGRINGDVLFYSSNNRLIAIYEYNNDIIKEIKLYTLDKESPPRNHDFLPNYD